jgi:hypothetical protein
MIIVIVACATFFLGGLVMGVGGTLLFLNREPDQGSKEYLNL